MTTHKNNPSETIEHRQRLSQRLEALNQYKIDLGLDRLHTVLKALNLDQLAAQIFTVGGTNGKGSTVAVLCELLSVKKRRFGAFTSPHIFAFNERININGNLATDAEILHAFDTIDTASADIKLSYFEYAFLAALLIFVEHQVEVIVLEVGLGGRLDATNAVDADAAIITTVDIDHTEWLGDDIESIALEKAGIMRSSQPIIYGDDPVPEAIVDQAEKQQAKLLRLNHDYEIQGNTGGWSYSHQSVIFDDLPAATQKGAWQRKNFASALTALLSLGFEFTAGELSQALLSWQVPGRLQTMQKKPLVLADVAHNRQAVSNLNQWLNDHPITGKTLAVFSVLADKDVDSWLGLLNDVVDHWFIFELDGDRAMTLEQLTISLANQVSLFSQFDTAKQAYQMALSVADESDRVLVFGSFHVLEAVYK